jgi:hypothetical protein
MVFKGYGKNLTTKIFICLKHDNSPIFAFHLSLFYILCKRDMKRLIRQIYKYSCFLVMNT